MTKFICLTLIGLLSFATITQATDTSYLAESYTYDTKKCAGEEDKDIKELENELSNCKIIMPDAPSTAEMEEAHYLFADCSIKVANKIFDRYYTKHNQQAKENFNNLVKAIYACSHDLNQRSDYGKEAYTGNMYNTSAITEAGFWIRDVVKMYLNKTRQECNDKVEYQ